MSVEFENLQIKKVITHLVYKRNEDGSLIEPHYSRSVTILDESNFDLTELIKERISGAFSRDSKSIEMKIVKTDEGLTFSLIDGILTDENLMAENSKKLAKKLAEAQTNKTLPGGAIFVIQGTIGVSNYDFLGIIKAERHGGINMSEKENEISVDILKNLVLTPQQKLYKIGVFIRHKSDASVDTKDQYKAIVFDTNLSQGNLFRAAQYFYDSFLGLGHIENSKKITYNFYQHSKSFINSHSRLTDEEKLNLVDALYTYLRVDKGATISVEEYSTKYLPSPEMQDEFADYMTIKNIPTRAFIKDVELLKKHFKKRKYKFSNNIKIEVPFESIEGKMKILEQTPHKTLIEVYGSLIEE